MARFRRGLGLLSILLLGAAVRLVHWDDVFTPSGIALGPDTDPYYHVLQAERMLRGEPGAPWLDRGLNWPVGAEVPWPPLFDGLIAASARVLHGADATRGEIERVAAILPVAVGLLTLLVVAGLGRTLLGPGRGTGVALIVALLWSHAAYTSVGAADQHGMEVLLYAAILLGYARSWTAASSRERGIAAVLAGLGVTLAFWNWMGSALNLVLPVTFAGIARLALGGRSDVARRVAVGTAIGLGSAAALLAASIVVWGPAGAIGRGTLLGITGLSVVLCTAGAAFAAVLAFVRSRVGLVAAPLAAAAAVAFVPSAREGIGTGLTALGAANPWYASIFEFQHLLFSCHFPLGADAAVALMLYGLAFVPAGFAAWGLARRFRAGDEAERSRVLFLACWAILFLLLALARRRFAPYFTVPLALLAWEGVWAATSGRRVWALAAALVAVAPSAADLRLPPGRFPDSSVEALRWLRSQPAPVAGREGVLANWNAGHAVLYHAAKPVVASPFGTEGGAGAMLDTARFNFAADLEQAAEILDRRRIGFVVLMNPLMEAAMDGAFAEPGNTVAIRTCTYREGLRIQYRPEYLDRLAPRLFLFDGMSRPEAPAPPIPFLRLLYETPPGRQEQMKLFGVVAGARVRVTGVGAGTLVSASTRLRTNQGRELAWETAAIADGSGTAILRLPYASGTNGAVTATAWTIRARERVVPLELAEADVVAGRPVNVDATP
jgi:dolichyl-diphosphooligosaccharide--protein glycosyltransferase